MNVNWTSACIENQEDIASLTLASQILTLKVNSVDGRSLDDSLSAGFTLSFKEANPPEFLRLNSAPIDTQDIDESWTDPPPSLRIGVNKQDFEDQKIEKYLEELHYLEAEAELIQELITAKKSEISQRLTQDLEASLHQCKGIFCYIKVVFKHTRKSVSSLHYRHQPNPFSSSLDPQVFILQKAEQQTAMIVPQDNQTVTIASNNPFAPTKTFGSTLASRTALPSPPEQCHCKGEDEEGWPELPARPSTGRSSRNNGARSSILWSVLQIFFTFTGIALIFRIIKKCCDRCRGKRKSQLPTRAQPQVTINTGRRNGWWSNISRRRAEKKAQRTSQIYRSMDEKQALVIQQETHLENQMQDEIRQLKVDEEIRQFRNTRNQIDELIRAEEGRGTSAPPYNANPFSSSSSPYITQPTFSNRTSHHSSHSIPPPLVIPSRHRSYPERPHDHHNPPSPSLTSSSSGNPFSPISRTTSLPSYRSKPPSYQGDGESSYAFSDDSGTDGEGDLADQDSWTSSDESSIPDLSPRPSRESLRTAFTGETARSFV